MYTVYIVEIYSLMMMVTLLRQHDVDIVQGEERATSAAAAM